MYLKWAVVFALPALIFACTPGAGPGLGELFPAWADAAAKPASSNNNDSDDNLRIRQVMELRQRYRGSSDIAGLDALLRNETEAAKHFLAAGFGVGPRGALSGGGQEIRNGPSCPA